MAEVLDTLLGRQMFQRGRDIRQSSVKRLGWPDVTVSGECVPEVAKGLFRRRVLKRTNLFWNGRRIPEICPQFLPTRGVEVKHGNTSDSLPWGYHGNENALIHLNRFVSSSNSRTPITAS